MKATLAVVAVMSLGACAAMPVGEVSERSPSSADDVCLEVALGAARGAVEGLRLARCVDRSCMPVAAVAIGAGAVIGGLQGLDRGLARARRDPQPAD